MKQVTILHQQVAAQADESEQDVLVQRDTIAETLRQLGYSVAAVACDLNLNDLRGQLQRLRTDVVFNLVESLAGTDRLMSVIPLLLESWQIPYTGCSSRAILETSDKLASKEKLQQAGLPTAAWQELTKPSALPLDFRLPVIIKAVNEHASFDLDDSSVCRLQDSTEVEQLLLARKQNTGRDYFAEQYIPGREFNLSVLAGEQEPVVLPVAEIDFSAFPEDKPAIVGYRAKWDAESPEYHLTPRRFVSSENDVLLTDLLQQLARDCWNLFSLSGYTRVDFRVDAAGHPWILEVNANPCLSPDAGFAAALAEAGIPYETAILRILESARRF